MKSVPDNAVRRHESTVQVISGEFADWWTWASDRFEAAAGPFFHREDGNQVRCAFRVERKHINASGAVHGGCLMTFADYCMFAIAHPALADKRGVTLSFSSEFIDAAYEGERIEGTGEIVRAGRSIIFLRGMLSSAGPPLLSFSGTIKQISAPKT